ncbi:sensor domain-containing diguanylate cyclase [Pleionea sp. CnH1-48]|uniref:sensor domain-containing diguanylate cyclase n=1 Tax=Pleionea sp. CnH1-48 TaxID=2954494 RepID=UPI002096D605|nr:sensor domain-containing diguanylate cyclase [Pleionea sp. CnH1-48]MCO7223123.1 sensor domain-containing diguanylate cyclase [Pleionea sp. CnH1-48]
MLDSEQWLLENNNSLVSLQKWQQTVDLLAELFHAPAGFLVQHTPMGYQVTISSDQESNPYPAGIIIEPDVNIFCRKIVETRQELYVKNAPIDPCWDTNPEVHNDGFVSYLGVPVYWPDGKPFGTFCVMDYKETDYQESYLKLIRQLKDILESDLEILGAYEKLKQLALTDDLTTLYNRRGFSMLAEQRILLAKRMKQELNLLYLDIDNFKQLNDQYSHSIGDKVLCQFADSMLETFRGSDIVGRLGGDEFCALIAIDEASDVSVITQRLKKHLHQQLSAKELPNIDFSFGSMCLDQEELNFSQVLHYADENMYHHKKSKKQQAS